jgi:hypothetical protein
VWQETQQVSMAADGRYSLLMGSTLPDGMPLELFTSGEPRWIGITVNRPGEAEQPRAHLASVAYALKAADADTLGGRPASAYLLADPALSPATSAASDHASKDTTTAASSGTAGYLGMFVDSANLGNSALVQSGGFVGLGTIAPRDGFHVAVDNGSGTLTGYAVQNLSSAAGAYSGMLFYDQNGALGQFQGFNNATHEYRINNIASGGSINFMIGSSSKFLVANNGMVGIGTNPTARLHVVDPSNTGLRVQTDSPGGTVASFGGFGAFRIDAPGVPSGRLSISEAGNVGIGVAGPGSKLDVAGDINLTGTLKVGGETVLRTRSNNIGLGPFALESDVLGQFNTGIGAYALRYTAAGLPYPISSHNTAVGTSALINNTTGSGNIGVGSEAGADLASASSNNIVIGSRGASADSGTIRIGTPVSQQSFFAAGVVGVQTGQNDAATVVVDSNGQLGTISSSRRFKEDIRDMGEASRGLLRLRPVTFRYKKPFDDGSKPIQYGLIAEEVAEVYPDLVARAADGQIETVKYQVLDAMLLNEVQQQQADIRALQAEIRAVVEQYRAVIQQNRNLQERLGSLEAAITGRR